MLSLAPVLATTMLWNVTTTTALPPRVAVVAFLAHPRGMNDEVVATPAQLTALEKAFVSDLRQRGVDAVASPVKCATEDEACYRNAARSVGAKIAISAEVTRYPSLLWNVDVAVHRASAASGTSHNEYKGDYELLLRTMPEVAAEVTRSLL